jgi:hypothetical protein
VAELQEAGENVVVPLLREEEWGTEEFSFLIPIGMLRPE